MSLKLNTQTRVEIDFVKILNQLMIFNILWWLIDDLKCLRRVVVGLDRGVNPRLWSLDLNDFGLTGLGIDRTRTWILTMFLSFSLIIFDFMIYKHRPAGVLHDSDLLLVRDSRHWILLGRKLVGINHSNDGRRWDGLVRNSSSHRILPITNHHSSRNISY